MNFDLNLLYNATDNLIEQQFYLDGQDTITGRTHDVCLHIKNSGIIIRKFKDLFNQNIDKFLEDDYYKFLLSLTKIKGISEKHIRIYHEELLNKIEVLKDNIDDLNDILIYNIVLSFVISKIRDYHFQEIIEEIYERIKIHSNDLSFVQINENFERLFMLNNKYISILYSIVFLEVLADSFNFKRVARVCKMQRGKFINRV